MCQNYTYVSILKVSISLQVHEELCLVHEAYQYFRGKYRAKLMKEKDWVHVQDHWEEENTVGLANKVNF